MKRKNLRCTFILIDVRLEPQKIDLEFLEWLGINQLPFVIIFTKSDKLNKTTLINNIERYKKTLLEKWAELPQFIVSSAITSQGKDADRPRGHSQTRIERPGHEQQKSDRPERQSHTGPTNQKMETRQPTPTADHTQDHGIGNGSLPDHYRQSSQLDRQSSHRLHS